MNQHNRTFFQFVIPSVMAFALSGVYTIADGFFVGNSLGDIGLASINLGYPISAFIQAVGTGVGLAGAIRFTILRGQKRQGEDKECFSSTVLLLAMLSILLMAVVMGLLSELLHLLGADGEAYLLAAEYVSIIALGAAFQIFATGLVPFIRNLGGASFAMAAMIAGFMTNIGLDFLFVWIFEWGMAGAAWATIIGQAVTTLATCVFLIRKKIGFCLPAPGKMPGFFREILKVSVAPFGLTFSPQVTTILMNRFLMVYGGEQPVAVYGCIAYIMAVAYLLLQGVGDGSQPLISQYFSEGDVPVMKQMRRLAYLTSAVIAACCMAGVFLTRSHIGVLFGASAETNADVARRLPLFLLTLLLLSYVRITTAFLYATERSGVSYLLVYAEPAAIGILLFALTRIPGLGLTGIWIAVPVAQGITWCIAIVVRRLVDRQATMVIF